MNIKRFLQPMYKPEPNGGTSSKKYLNARVQMKKDTAANWEAANPVILAGEFIIVTTANGETRFKVGDGTKRYTQLPYTDEPLRSLVGEKLGKTEAAAKVQNKLNIFGKEYNGSAPITVDVIGDATTTQSGLMSAADKKTLGDVTPFIVIFSRNSEGTFSCNKTFAQVEEAINTKKFVYGLGDNGDGTFSGPFCCQEQSSVDGTNKAFHFTSWYSEIYAKISYPSVMNIILYNTDTIKFIKHSAVVREQFEGLSGIIKIDGVSTVLQQAVPGTDYAAASHTHTQDQVIGLTEDLNGKADSVHTHAMSDVTNLSTTLSNKADSIHTHTIAQVTDLETRLAALEAREIGTKVTLYRYVSA